MCGNTCCIPEEAFGDGDGACCFSHACPVGDAPVPLKCARLVNTKKCVPRPDRACGTGGFFRLSG